MKIEKTQIIEELCEIFNKHEIKQKEILDIVMGFLYHLGVSLEDRNFDSSEELLKEYAIKPTIGLALMAQGLWIRDIWKRKDS